MRIHVPAVIGVDVKARGMPWAKSVFSGRALYVCGNHELYSGHLSRTLEKKREDNFRSCKCFNPG